jgi:hypothetical protein
MIHGTIENLDVVVSGLENSTLDVREAAFQGVLLALNAAFKACETMLSPTDHSLRELALMGHPYGFTHPQTIHQPDELVHLQTGAYRDALEKVSPQGSHGDIIEGRVQIGESMADLDRWIQEGTTRLRARPWMAYVVREYGADFADIIESRIQESLKNLA